MARISYFVFSNNNYSSLRSFILSEYSLFLKLSFLRLLYWFLPLTRKAFLSNCNRWKDSPYEIFKSIPV